MNKNLYKMGTLFLVLMMALPAYAVTQTYIIDDVALKLSQTKYDPYPIEPGKYFTLWLEIENYGTKTANNVSIRLDPEYPFSLDPNEEQIKTFAKIPGLNSVVVEYKVRADSNAVDGYNTLKLSIKTASSGWATREFELYINKTPTEAELEPILSSVEPSAYPTGVSIIDIDIANIAPGTAYYLLVEASSPVAKLEPEKTFIGTLDADDFDTVELTATFDNVTPGRYPINLVMRYKDDEYNKITEEKTVYINLISKEKALESLKKKTPTYMYVIYAVVIVLLLKFFVINWVKKTYEFFSQRKTKKGYKR